MVLNATYQTKDKKSFEEFPNLFLAFYYGLECFPSRKYAILMTRFVLVSASFKYCRCNLKHTHTHTHTHKKKKKKKKKRGMGGKKALCGVYISAKTAGTV